MALDTFSVTALRLPTLTSAALATNQTNITKKSKTHTHTHTLLDGRGKEQLKMPVTDDKSVTTHPLLFFFSSTASSHHHCPAIQVPISIRSSEMVNTSSTRRKSALLRIEFFLLSYRVHFKFQAQQQSYTLKLLKTSPHRNPLPESFPPSTCSSLNSP
jgi:hypothetical protein